MRPTTLFLRRERLRHPCRRGETGAANPPEPGNTSGAAVCPHSPAQSALIGQESLQDSGAAMSFQAQIEYLSAGLGRRALLLSYLWPRNVEPPGNSECATRRSWSMAVCPNQMGGRKTSSLQKNLVAQPGNSRWLPVLNREKLV